MEKDTRRFVPEYRKMTFRARMSNSETDRRRKRDLTVASLRRHRRDQKVSKTRNCTNVPPNESEDEQDERELSQGHLSEEAVYSQLAQAQQYLFSDHTDNVLYGVRLLRDALSEETIEASVVQSVVDSPVLAKLVELLSHNDYRIQYESAWAVTNVASGTSAQTRALVSLEGVPALVRALKNGRDQLGLSTQIVWALGNIAGEHWQYRDWILGLNVVPDFLHILANAPPQELTNVTWALTNFCRGQELDKQWDHLKPLLPALHQLLQCADHSAISDACWCLYGIMSKIKDSAFETVSQQQQQQQPGILTSLFKLLDYRSVTIRIPVLRTIGAMLTDPTRIDQLEQEHGVLSRAETVLTDPNCQSLHQDALFVVGQIAQNGTAVQVKEMLKRCIVYVMREISARDVPTKCDALIVVKNALHNSKMTPHMSQLNLVDKGVIQPLCKQLDPQSDNLVLKLTLECLKRLLKNGAAKMTDNINVLAVYIEQLDGIKRLNNVIDNSRNAEIYELACNLLDVYFSDKSNQF